MGNLSTYLQREFNAKRPPGWHCRHEVPLLSPKLAQLLGYSPRVDVLLEREDGGRRLWIEFEISRADPVANHAKFATAQLFQPQPAGDVFLSMVSPDVTRGRRNLAANPIWLMRHIGMEAYQTHWLPHTLPADIRRLNYLVLDAIAGEALDVESEIERALLVSQSLAATATTNIHFVANLMEVVLNVHQWNRDLATAKGRELWGKRTVTYFVYDPRSRHFAPSKFCAYVSIPSIRQQTTPLSGSTMTIESYTQVDRAEPIFDGRQARLHLEKNLAMKLVTADEQPQLLAAFDRWKSQHDAGVNVHPSGPVFLCHRGGFSWRSVGVQRARRRGGKSGCFVRFEAALSRPYYSMLE